MNASFNPHEAIKLMQNMPESLKKEIEGNTSLSKSQVTGNKHPELFDGYIDNRLRSDKPITFLSFIDDLRRLWEAAGKSGKIIRQTPLKEEAKAEDYPVITYRVIRRIVNEHFKDIKPRFRTTMKHPYMDGQYIELYGQIFDLWVEFCIYSPNAEEADETVMEFEEFLQNYAGFFKKNGVQEILFHAQGEDEVLEESRIPIAKRKILYTIRFEKIVVRFLNEIQELAIQANIYSKDN